MNLNELNKIICDLSENEVYKFVYDFNLETNKYEAHIYWQNEFKMNKAQKYFDTLFDKYIKEGVKINAGRQSGKTEYIIHKAIELNKDYNVRIVTSTSIQAKYLKKRIEKIYKKLGMKIHQSEYFINGINIIPSCNKDAIEMCSISHYAFFDEVKPTGIPHKNCFYIGSDFNSEYCFRYEGDTLGGY